VWEYCWLIEKEQENKTKQNNRLVDNFFICQTQKPLCFFPCLGTNAVFWISSLQFAIIQIEDEWVHQTFRSVLYWSYWAILFLWLSC
jgi:hypothetical protein